MSTVKPSKLCRICLKSVTKKSMSIFEKFMEFTINDYILLITNVEIKKNDGFPDRICSNCFVELESAVKFKQKCEGTDLLLKASKDKLLEVCAVAGEKDIKELIIVKKEEPCEIEIKFDDTDGNIQDECGIEIETLEEELVDNVKPFKSKAIDLKLECHDCGNFFKSKCKLRVHWKKAHMLSSLICDICKRRFKSYRAFHSHKVKGSLSCKTAGDKLVKVEGEGRSRTFYCVEKGCGYKTNRIKDIQTHIIIHKGDKPFLCTLCPSRFTQQSSLQCHMEASHNKYRIELTCHFCGKQIKGRSKVYRHMKSHTAEKYPCPICQKKVSKAHLKSHMQRHTGVKTYTCEKCASTFYTMAELCNHRRWVHNKIKNEFSCDICGYSASRRERINIHRRNHVKNNMPCTICGMFFTSEQKLEMHKKRHFEEKKHQCTYCDKKFFRRDSLNKHIKTIHKFLVATQVNSNLNDEELKTEHTEKHIENATLDKQDQFDGKQDLIEKIESVIIK